MQVKEVLVLAATAMGRDDLGKDLGGSASSDGVAALLRCYNLVESEIALDYFPLRARETFVPEGGKIVYTRFSHAPVDVQAVTTVRGASVRFTRLADCVAADCAEAVEVTYSYAPEPKGLADETAFSGRISARLLAYGVCSEFLLAQAKYAEAAAFDGRYREALAAANVLRRKLGMRARRWA